MRYHRVKSRPVQISKMCLLLQLALFFGSLFDSQSHVHAASCAQNLARIIAHTKSHLSASPFKTHHVKLPLVRPNGAHLVRLKKKVLTAEQLARKGLQPEKNGLNRIQYVVGLNDELFYIDPNQVTHFRIRDLGENDLLMVQGIDPNTGELFNFAAKESGYVAYVRDPEAGTTLFGNKKKTKNYVFYKQHGLDLTEDEYLKIRGQMEGVLDEQEGAYWRNAHGKSYQKAAVVKCNQIFRDHTRNDRFIIDKVQVDMVTMTGALVLMNSHRFDGTKVYWGLQENDPEKDYDEDLLAADYISTLVNSTIRAGAGLGLTAAGVSFAVGGTLRIPVSMGSIAAQTLIYRGLTDNDANKIGLFNLGYMFFAIGKGHFVDRWVYEYFPKMAYNSCLSGTLTRFIVSPRMIRYGEGVLSSVIYFAARHVVLESGAEVATPEQANDATVPEQTSEVTGETDEPEQTSEVTGETDEPEQTNLTDTVDQSTN